MQWLILGCNFLLGLASSADSDIVACMFNEARSKAGLPSVSIAKLLVSSSVRQVNYMTNVKQLTTTGKRGISVAERLSNIGYDWTYAYGLVGQNYPDAKEFAMAMLKKHRNEILIPQVTHMGVAHSGIYWNIDMGDTKKKVTTLKPQCKSTNQLIVTPNLNSKKN